MTAYAIDVRDYGAVPDARQLADGSCSGTGASSPTANFTVADVGKSIKITNGYTNDGIFRGTISSVTNSTTIVLSGSVISSVSGTAQIYYGTNNSTSLQNAFDAANALVKNPNVKIKVVGPASPNGGGYLFTSPLSSDLLDIDFEAPLYSSVGLGAGDFTVPWELGDSHITNLLMDVGGGMGPLWGNADGHVLFLHEKLIVINAGFNGQSALTGQGFGFNINGFIGIQSGSIGVDFSNCQDVHCIGQIDTVGCVVPLIINGTENSEINLLCDTPVSCSFKMDGCRNVVLNCTNIVNGSNTAATGLIGSVSTVTNRGIVVNLLAQASGGPAMYVDYCDGGVQINIVATNKPLNSGVHNNITFGLSYGSHNSGTLDICVTRDSDIPLSIGTVYGNLTDVCAGAVTYYGQVTAKSLAVNGTSPPSGDGFYNPAAGVITSHANGNPVLGVVGVTSAANYAFISNSVSANPSAITFGAAGTDSNIIISLAGKGTGWVQFSPNTASGKGLIIKGVSGQTANLFEVQNISNTNLAHFDGSGNFRSNGTNVIVGNAALSTSATSGFLYIPTCAGAPTGTPTTNTGTCAMVFDTMNNKLCVYSGGAWKKTVALT